MPKKRNRDDEDTADTTVAAENKNEELAKVFEQLMMYEAKAGSKFASVAYKKIVVGIRNHKKPITSGAMVSALPGFGKAAVTKIDEYLKSGTVKKLDDFKESMGALGDSLTKSAAAATAGSKKATKDAAGGKPPTKAVLKKIADARENYEDESVDSLKKLLKLNGQTTTGAKGDLLDRVAHGKVLGRIPVCPLCGAGKLRWDIKTGIYKCPGYMDDDVFAPCVFQSGEVTRDDWQEA